MYRWMTWVAAWVLLGAADAQAQEWGYASQRVDLDDGAITWEQSDPSAHAGDQRVLYRQLAKLTSDTSASVEVQLYPGDPGACQMRYRMSWTRPQRLRPGVAETLDLALQDDGSTCPRVAAVLTVRTDFDPLVTDVMDGRKEYTLEAGGEPRNAAQWWPNASQSYTLEVPSVPPDTQPSGPLLLSVRFAIREPLSDFPGGAAGSVEYTYALDAPANGEDSAAGPDGSDEWIVVVGAGLAGGAALGALIRRRINQRRARDGKPLRYVLQLSRDSITLDRRKSQDLRISVLRVQDNGTTLPAPEARIGLALAPEDPALKIAPRAGSGTLNVSLKLSGDASTPELALQVWAELDGSRKQATVSLHCPAALQLRVGMEGGHCSRVGDADLWDVDYDAKTGRWRLQPLHLYFTGSTSERPIEPPFEPRFLPAHSDCAQLAVPAKPATRSSATEWILAAPTMTAAPDDEWLFGDGEITITIECVESAKQGPQP